MLAPDFLGFELSSIGNSFSRDDAMSSCVDVHHDVTLRVDMYRIRQHGIMKEWLFRNVWLVFVSSVVKVRLEPLELQSSSLALLSDFLRVASAGAFKWLVTKIFSIWPGSFRKWWWSSLLIVGSGSINADSSDERREARSWSDKQSSISIWDCVSGRRLMMMMMMMIRFWQSTVESPIEYKRCFPGWSKVKNKFFKSFDTTAGSFKFPALTYQ